MGGCRIPALFFDKTGQTGAFIKTGKRAALQLKIATNAIVFGAKTWIGMFSFPRQRCWSMLRLTIARIGLKTMS